MWSIMIIVFCLSYSAVTLCQECENNIFIALTNRTVFLLDFNVPADERSSSIIFESSSNATIHNGVFDKRTNAFVLLLVRTDQTSFMISLKVNRNIYDLWTVKQGKTVGSSMSHIHLTIGRRHIYTLDTDTMILQKYDMSLSSPFSSNQLLNLTTNQQIQGLAIDERFDSLWILTLISHRYRLYICHLKSFHCDLSMNIFNLTGSIRFYLDWDLEQLFIYSLDQIIIFKYKQNQIEYQHLQLTTWFEDQFLTVCDTDHRLQYLFVNKNNRRQICLHSCHTLPFTTDTTSIHTLRRLSSLSRLLHCTRQRRYITTIVGILILAEILVILLTIGWFAIKYRRQCTPTMRKKQLSNETIWTIDTDDFITRF